MGKLSIDLTLENIWRSWYAFRQGKKASLEIDHFQYYLEQNLSQLFQDIQSESYLPSPYRTFMVTDNKKRRISVAPVRDRVVHRLLYDYLVKLYDHSFEYDVWSCRKNKGLTKAIERTQKLLASYPNYYIWRCDITKFFDNVDRNTLLAILKRRVMDRRAVDLLQKIINHYAPQIRRGLMENIGIPIGNLTSQIFANIYLNELDRFIRHKVRPKAYTRYGDDFIVLMQDRPALVEIRALVASFLLKELGLKINSKNDYIFKACRGLFFLGVEIFPGGRRLKKRNLNRAVSRLNSENISSYRGLVHKHSNQKTKRRYNWEMLKVHEWQLD